MGLRFRKSINLGKMFRINLSKSGIGTSVGVPGFRISRGPRGRRTTVSIPGTGLSHVSQQSKKKSLKPVFSSSTKEPTGSKPRNNKTCGVLFLIGLGLFVVLMIIALITSGITSLVEWIRPDPTVSVDQAVAQLNATMTMQAALDQVMAEMTDQATPFSPTLTPAPVMLTFSCQECVNDDGSILPITLWQTPDEIGASGGQVLHGERCELIQSAISTEGISKTLVDCPGGRGWTRTESLIP